jgi:hypothetical protein
MATSLPSDMKVYNEQFFAGYTEELEKNLAVFNANSANTILMSSDVTNGEFIKEAYLAKISGLVTRRDNTSTSSVTGLKATQGEIVKVDRSIKIGPVEFTDEAVHKGNMTFDEMVFLLGQQAAEEVMNEHVDAVLYALQGAYNVTALSNGLVQDSSGATMTHNILNNGLAKMGDQASKVSAWVMHSSVFFELQGQAITDKIDSVAGTVIYGGNPGTLGRPVIVTDSDALFSNGSSSVSTDNYYTTYGLVPAAAEVQQTRVGNPVIERVGGNEQIINRMQAEENHTIGIKGMSFNTATVNPTVAQLASSSNWTQSLSQLKALAGVQIKTKKTNALG